MSLSFPTKDGDYKLIQKLKNYNISNKIIEQTTPDFTSTQAMHFSPIPFSPPISLQMADRGAEIY